MRGALLAAALAFLWANRAGCCWLAGHTPHTVRGPAPLVAPSAAPPPEVRALVFGDFGDTTCQQAEVARGLAAAQARAPFDLALSVGDNLYECGPDLTIPGAAACDFGPDGAQPAAGTRTPDDDRFGRLFERPLAGLQVSRPLPVYLVLGNHDVADWGSCRPGDLPPERAGRARACLEVAHRSASWKMPGRHWVLDQGPVRFIGLDSNVVVQDYGGFTLEEEIAFLRQASVGCRDRPCFLVAHHPPASAGAHEDAVAAGASFLARVGRLEAAAAGPIAAWLTGHDHDLQHLRTPGGIDVFVSGNGSRWRDEKFASVGPPLAQLHFASTTWGHAVLEGSATHWALRFEDTRGNPLHCCQAVFPGPCRPVGCK